MSARVGALFAVVVTGCGRIGFDVGGTGDDGGPDAVPGSARYVDEVLADHPLAYYRLDDTVTTDLSDILDSSGNDQTARLEIAGGTFGYVDGGAIVGDPSHGALFGGEGNAGDASRAAIRFPMALSQWTGDWTVETWIRPTARFFINNHRMNLICEHYMLNGFRTGWDTEFHLAVWTDEAGATTDLFSQGAMTVGAWSHVVTIRRGSLVEMWLDGQLDTQATFDYLPPDGVAECEFGAAHGMPAEAAWDEVAIYDYALAPARVVAHRSAGIAP